jgi:hypothetical protein
MAGFLDSKQRMIDVLITNEGRRQLARGKMQIKFATFTDLDAFYEADVVSGSSDATLRPHIEAFSRSQDRITFESDSAGNLSEFSGGDKGMLAGNVLITSGSKFLNFPSSSIRREAQLDILTSSFDHFSAQMLLSTDDPLDDDMAFTLGAESIGFDVVDDTLSNRQGVSIASLNDVESFFQDKRLSHIPNFKYMPPRNASTPEEPEGSLLGDYPRFDQGNIMTFSDLMAELADREHRVVRFTETSRDGNIFGQFFEIRDDIMKKLDVIDFGEHIDQASGISQHVYFAGRIFVDNRGSHTFVNLFTLIFS